ncbi:MAG: SusE domain-containing protein, partial [Methylophilaceae bacterium]
MKHIQKLWFFLLAAGLLFTACEKNIEGGGEIAVFSNGKQPVISASAATIAPAAADSNNVALTLSWTNPEYSIDSNTVKYVIEIDSTNRNFSKSVTRTVTGTRRISM